MRFFLLGLSLIAATAGVAHAQEVTPGAQLYGYYCAYCHGVNATGDGTLARFLKIPVPDLTALAARNGGEFPMLDVVHQLDGTREDKLHGGPMPDFGPLFDEENLGYYDQMTAIVDRNGRILTIALYLEQLQKP
ncbi:c-type cytochrome [Paracoccus benzoatiresistens]|uniref:Cytochrome c n=1 Tax=Paracoccus benzoatiresistens TaxID=2997341 RepID=A0ABT4J9R4_9RHOB|nr:cytochrome c [Paracoccus sp. EF6]MCZ0963191.1 cytochrome c [Paracoccus sp. EF6]